MSEAASPEASPAAERAPKRITVERASPADAPAVHRIVVASGVLDPCSAYAYVLLCDRFRDTCLVARQHNAIVGFVTAFVPPRDPGTVFVWQIGVDARARGQGVGSRLLDALFEQPACRDVTHLEATVAPSNRASDRLFRALARRRRASVAVLAGYGPELFPDAHESEPLYRIGPLSTKEE